MAVKSKLQQAGDGTAIPAGFVGEMVGATQAGTGGASYHTTSTTVAGINSNTVAVASLTLNKGSYILNFSVGQQKAASATTTSLLVSVRIGGTKVYPGTAGTQLASTTNISGAYIPISGSIPITISADSTSVQVMAGWIANETAGTDVINVISAIRIA